MRNLAIGLFPAAAERRHKHKQADDRRFFEHILLFSSLGRATAARHSFRNDLVVRADDDLHEFVRTAVGAHQRHQVFLVAGAVLKSPHCGYGNFAVPTSGIAATVELPVAEVSVGADSALTTDVSSKYNLEWLILRIKDLDIGNAGHGAVKS
jgi:hypothetical protein